MKRDFTATCYVIEDEKVLLIFHKKLKKWLPPGGHVDPNELPHEAAIREAFEETGIVAELIDAAPVQFNYENSRSLPHPFMTALEEIPAHKDVPAHQHIDFMYVAKRIGGETIQNVEETSAIRWFSEKEVALIPEDDIFRDTREILIYLIRQQCPIMQCT